MWRRLVSLVIDSRGDWRRSVVEATGLPFTRFRALRRLAPRPLTLVELAHSLTVDAPAATVAVNDLEQRGLVLREPHPTNRRCKLVRLTDEGKRTLDVAAKVPDTVPAALTALSPAELGQLGGFLDRIERWPAD